MQRAEPLADAQDGLHLTHLASPAGGGPTGGLVPAEPGQAQTPARPGPDPGGKGPDPGGKGPVLA